MFRRCRFPDFAVTDASGHRLNLVTRRQHQHCITLATICQYFDANEWSCAATAAPEELRDLYDRLAKLITDIEGTDGTKPREVRNSARRLLAAMGKDEEETERISSLLALDSEQLARYTHYLCWVPAKWGETVSLSATYTMSDSVRIAGAPRKELQSPSGDDELGWWPRFRMRWYTRLNIFPVSYELRAPAHDHAGSYYLTIDPPDDSHVSLLDWGAGRSFGGATAEIDCAYSTCHIHNGERLPEREPRDRRSIVGAKISAFLKGDPVDHAALLAVAVLNVVLAYLAQKGSFLPSHSDSQQQWLLLAPTVVVALIAQHRRRYYSSVTKPVRAVLWGYLTMNVAFGASVAFDVFGGDALDDFISAGMACVSLALAGLLIVSGGMFERVTNWIYRRRHSDQKTGGPRRYLRIVRHYADVSIALILILVGGALILMLDSDWGGQRQTKAAAQQERESRDNGISSSPAATPQRPAHHAPGKGPASGR